MCFICEWGSNNLFLLKGIASFHTVTIHVTLIVVYL